nr:ribonuclease H-like domain-containing protein [Tanacetum cinerariifolium]
NADGISTSTIYGPITTEEKAQKKNDVKARSMLLMALPNEHILTFSQYKDAKTLFEAIQARFGGNDATKKTQRTLLKQILPAEWNTRVVVRRNKADLDTMSIDLEQIYEDDLEEMDLKWQLALLSVRARRSPKNQESRTRNQASSRKTVVVEDTSSKAVVPIDGVVEYRGVANVVAETTWLRNLLRELHSPLSTATLTGHIRVLHVPSRYQYADIFTKENGNPFKPVPRTTVNADGTSTSTIHGPVTTEEKAQKKNDVKARIMLLMALPNEHLLTFSQYRDAKTLFEAIQAIFRGNDATKKTQRTLLKQMYKNFNAPSTESLDFIFNMLKKIVSQYDIMSIDDLYNNFKIIEQEVKRTVASASSSRSPNMAFIFYPGSTNEVDTTTNQPNGSQLIYEDLEQIHEDDLEEIDLKWQLALLSMRARRWDILHGNAEVLGIKKASQRIKTTQERLNVEVTSSKAMVAIDGAGFDWSYMADDEVPTNMPFMAFSDSEEFQHPKFKGYGPKDSKSVCVDTSNEIKKVLDALIIEDWVSNSDEDLKI